MKTRKFWFPVIWAIDAFLLLNAIGTGANRANQGYGGDAGGFGFAIMLLAVVLPFTVIATILVLILGKITDKNKALNQGPYKTNKWYCVSLLIIFGLIGFTTGVMGLYLIELIANSGYLHFIGVLG